MQEVEIRERKGGHGFAIFLLCIAFFLIGAGGAYYYLTVYINKNKEEVTDIVNINPNGILVKELISRIDDNTNYCGINPDLYKKSKLTVENMDPNYIKALVAKEAYGKKIDGNISFTKEEYEQAINTVFGSNVTVAVESLVSTCPSIIYDSANQVFRQNGDSSTCNKICGTTKTLRYNVKAEKTNQNIFIYVAVANKDEISGKISNVNDPNSVVNGIDVNTFDIAKDFEKVNNYKYTYNYDHENNNYIFKSIELVK